MLSDKMILFSASCIKGMTSMEDKRTKRGFTLLELMIVVGIIGIMLMIAVPNFLKARKTSQVTRFVSDLRAIESAFLQYSFQHIGFPPDAPPGIVPTGMEDYLERIAWDKETTLGGNWDWSPAVANFGHAIRLVNSNVDDETMLVADTRIDDGDLSSGALQKDADGTFIYLVE